MAAGRFGRRGRRAGGRLNPAAALRVILAEMPAKLQSPATQFLLSLGFFAAAAFAFAKICLGC